MVYSKWNSVPEYVVDEIRKLLQSRKYLVGDRFLTEKEVSEQFHVGRSSVREAFRILQAMGYIEIQRGRGAFVTKTSDDDPGLVKKWYKEHKEYFQDIVELRIFIETLALKRAITKLSSDLLIKLKKNVERGQEATKAKNIHLLIKLDEEFHNLIVEASGNRLFMLINKEIQKAASDYRGKAFTIEKFLPYAAESHARILACVEKRDIDSAVNEIKEHIMTAVRHFNEVSARE